MSRRFSGSEEIVNYSAGLGVALAKGSLAFHVLGGASKLPYALSLLQSSICNYYVFIDDDDAGRKGFTEAQKSLLASVANTSFTKCLGLPEAEFEDLLHPDLYAPYFMTRFSLDVQHKPFDAKQKWSTRIRFGLTKAGKSSGGGEVWSETDEYNDKRAIAELARQNPAAAIHPSREDVIKNLVTTLEAKLTTLAAGRSK